MTLIWHSYLVSDLGNYIIKLCKLRIEIGLVL
jgi:hypothetical protein